MSIPVDILIFSRERTLQLYSLIRSLTELTTLREEDLTVLYLDSPDIPYAPLMERVRCTFIRQENFLHDAKRILTRTSNPYVCFMVDDLIYRLPVDWEALAGFLNTRTDVDGFSLRLGRNIIDNPSPSFSPSNEEFLVWDTAEGLGKSWNYFWELMSTVYRKERVLRYLRRCSDRKVTYPNPLEGYFYNKYPTFCGGRYARLWRFLPNRLRSHRMACYPVSRCFTQGVNMVASREIAYDAAFSPRKLHQFFLEGCRIDYACLRNISNPKANAGAAHFRLLQADGSLHPETLF